MQVVDRRTDTVFHDPIANLKGLNIKLANIEDPIAWLSQALQQELAARDVLITIVNTQAQAAADLTLTVRRFQISSRRYSGFSPWDTYDSFRGELAAAGGQTCDIRACFMNGKVPMWSMNEVEEPCFNLPLSVLVKEIASKINRSALHYSVSDERLKEIQGQAEAKVKAPSVARGSYPSVIDLGSVNNLNAVKAIVPYVEVEDRLTRACALSAIGTIGAQDQLDFLKKKFETCNGIDKYRALKSIGDLGTPEALDFVRKSSSDPQYDKKIGLKYIVDLYLEK